MRHGNEKPRNMESNGFKGEILNASNGYTLWINDELVCDGFRTKIFKTIKDANADFRTYAKRHAA